MEDASHSRVKQKTVPVRVLLLGDRMVGKTAIKSKFIWPSSTLQDDYIPTIIPDFLTKKLIIDHCLVNLVIWDSSGNDKYFSSCEVFYKYNECCLLVFDLNNEESLKKLDKFRLRYLDRCKDNKLVPFVVLLGNKSDIQPSETEAMKLAIKNICECWGGAPFFRTSAKTGENIPEVFNLVIKMALTKRNNVVSHNHTVPKNEPKQRGKTPSLLETSFDPVQTQEQPKRCNIQ